MNKFITRVNANVLLEWLDLPKSVYHYKSKMGKAGAKPSTTTLKIDGTIVSNLAVVEDIKQELSGEFVCYGYQNVTAALQENYKINHKKVYRLMKDAKLLNGKTIKTTGKREFVRFRTIKAAYPLEYLCMDIKYVFVDGEKQNYLLLSVIDVYSRKIIKWVFQKSIKKKDVIIMFKDLDLSYGLKGVFIRNDNGGQFIANDVKNYFKSINALQEFTHVATPQENSYIEAFHSILQREVIDRFEFLSGYDAKTTIVKYMDWYNLKRRHGRINRITPQRKWDQGMSLLSGRPPIARLAECFSRPDSQGLSGGSALYSLDKHSANAYLCLPDNKNLNQQ